MSLKIFFLCLYYKDVRDNNRQLSKMRFWNNNWPIDPNNSWYFWINRDLEIESKRNYSSSQKYRKELTPNITFQRRKTFVRNDLFERIIKSYKTTNLDFLKFKEKLGLCLYEVICNEQEFISMSEENFKKKEFLRSIILNISN